MRVRKLTVLFLSFMGLLLATWVVFGQTRRVDDLTLRNAGKAGEEWLTYGLTPGETRYSPLRQIDTNNVSRLGVAWLFEIGPGGGNQEAVDDHGPPSYRLPGRSLQGRRYRRR